MKQAEGKKMAKGVHKSAELLLQSRCLSCSPPIISLVHAACTYLSMPRQDLPDNWEDDTSFDGPEHWGMADRWKHLFPKCGVRASSRSSRNNSSGNESDGARSVDAGNGGSSANSAKKVTVDISKDDGDDGISLSSDDDHYGSSGGVGATNNRRGSMGRRSFPATAPQHEQRELLLASPSLSRSSEKASSKEFKNMTDKRGTSSDRSTSSKARRDEARMTARRWRSGTKTTEPASSSRAGRSGSAHEISLCNIRDLLTSSEEEEEFDDSEANITGHERTAPLASTTHGRQPAHKDQIDDRRGDDAGASQILLQRSVKRNHNSNGGGRADGNRTNSGGSGNFSAEEGRRVEESGAGGAGGATSPFACDAFSCYSEEDDRFGVGVSRTEGQPEEDVEGVDSSDGGLVDSDSSGDNSRLAGLKRITSSNIHRGGGRPHKKGDHKFNNDSPTVGSPSAHGGGKDRRRSRSNSTASPRGALVLTEGGRGTGGGASKKRPADSSGGKKARKVVPAKKGQDGWISKGGGSGGGISPRNPVDAFQGPQASIRKNAERGLTQSKLSFPVLDS